MQNLLDDLVSELVGLDVCVPKAQYLSPGGIIPWDEESITVYLGEIQQGQPGHPVATTYLSAIEAQFFARVFAQIVRKQTAVPGSDSFSASANMPSVAQMTADACQAMTDAAGLLTAAQLVHASYLASSPGEGFVVGPLSTLGPDGGLAAVRIALEISLS